MASLTRWMWIWVNSGSWWWTGRPGVLRFMGSQRVGHDWATELKWTDGMKYVSFEDLTKFLKNSIPSFTVGLESVCLLWLAYFCTVLGFTAKKLLLRLLFKQIFLFYMKPMILHKLLKILWSGLYLTAIFNEF